jgi:hypothetical protein
MTISVRTLSGHSDFELEVVRCCFVPVSALLGLTNDHFVLVDFGGRRSSMISMMQGSIWFGQLQSSVLRAKILEGE